jgi:hypothetical protein
MKQMEVAVAKEFKYGIEEEIQEKEEENVEDSVQ